MLVKVRLCERCAAKLRELLAGAGEVKMAEIAGDILSACPTCREQLPKFTDRRGRRLRLRTRAKLRH